MREVTIRVLARKGDSKGEIRHVIDVVYWDISVVILSAQQEAKHVESVAGKIILKKFARQSHMLVRLGGNPMTMTLDPSMTMHSVLQKENTQKWSPYK